MSVEVRQMIIKSNVMERSASSEPQHDDEDGKIDLLEECRRMIQEALREMKER